MKQAISWVSHVLQSEEHCEISVSDVGIEIRGSIRSEVFEINYTLELSPDWQVQHVVVRDVRNDGNDLDLQYENGQWFDVDGWHLATFDGVEYVDISITPATNTAPLKRLQFLSDEPQKIDVLYIDLPSFGLRRMEQYYSKIGSHTYRYQDGEHRDSHADLVVDEQGMVVVYPNLFIARTPQM